MSRRFIVILTLSVLIIAALATHPWSLTSSGTAEMLARQLNREYGLDTVIRGTSTLSLLPRPRLKVSGVEIRGIDGRLSISDATLRGHVSVFSLLKGRIELSDLALRNAAASLDIRGADERFWTRWAAWMQLRNSRSSIRQLLVSGGSLRILRDRHPEIVLSNINGAVDWPGSTAMLSLTGSLRWNGENIAITTASVQPSALLAGKSGPFALDIAALDSRLAASGTIRIDRTSNIVLDGKTAFSSKSMRQLTQWASLPVPLSPVLENFVLDGAFTTTRNLISWPAVHIVLGKNKFEGSLAFRFDNLGNMVSGTLATDNLDLAGYLAPLAPLARSGSSLSYRNANRADLDLRLSAGSGTLGALKMSEIALGLIVKPDRFEASLSRAMIDSGTVKGRFLMTGPVSEKEIRLQGSIDNIDIARFLPARADGGAPLSGLVHSQITLEGKGADLRGVLQSSHGKMTLTLTRGEISGFDLPVLLRSAISEPQPVMPSSTYSSFTNAALTLNIEAGQGVVSGGTVQGGNWQAALQGSLSLPNRSLQGQIQSENGEHPVSLRISDLLAAPKFILLPGKDIPAEAEKQ